MTDRTSKYPGRIKLTNVETGQVSYYDMERADEPTQMGTGLVKANLLTDATAQMLGLSGDPTINDAFAAIANGAGGNNVFYAVCESLPSEQYKEINIQCNSDPPYGTVYFILFEYGNDAANPILFINYSTPTETGQKQGSIVKRLNTTLDPADYWYNNQLLCIVYAGSTNYSGYVIV